MNHVVNLGLACSAWDLGPAAGTVFLVTVYPRAFVPTIVEIHPFLRGQSTCHFSGHRTPGAPVCVWMLHFFSSSTFNLLQSNIKSIESRDIFFKYFFENKSCIKNLNPKTLKP